MGNTPYVVIVNEKSDEGQKVLEALEENIEKMDIGSHRELVIFFFVWLNHQQKDPKKRKNKKLQLYISAPVQNLKNIRELAKIMHRSLFFGQKHNSNEEMKPDSIETEIFKILRILKSMKKAEDKDLIINLLDDISLFLDENV